MSAARGFLAPPEPAAQRGRRFVARRDAWRTCAQRFHARHLHLEPHAPRILAAMFDRALAEVGPTRSYILQAAGIAEHVRLNGETWRWHTSGGTCDGRGFYELWAWRFDIPVHHAAADLRALCFAEDGA